MKPALAIARTVFEAVIDAVLPLRERARRTKRLTAESIPLFPTTHELLGVKITTLMDYENKTVADLIQSLKYDGSGHAARLLASVIADYLRDEIASHKLFSQKTILITPVPLHASRKRERGFNQIEVVLKHLPDNLLPYMKENPLERTRPTLQQTRLSRSERLSNVAGAFALRNPESVRSTKIFLIDDVMTTGATLANAGNPLRRAGADVTLLALARA